jgi:hypothetical protein
MRMRMTRRWSATTFRPRLTRPPARLNLRDIAFAIHIQLEVDRVLEERERLYANMPPPLTNAELVEQIDQMTKEMADAAAAAARPKEGEAEVKQAIERLKKQMAAATSKQEEAA